MHFKKWMSLTVTALVIGAVSLQADARSSSHSSHSHSSSSSHSSHSSSHSAGSTEASSGAHSHSSGSSSSSNDSHHCHMEPVAPSSSEHADAPNNSGYHLKCDSAQQMAPSNVDEDEE